MALRLRETNARGQLRRDVEVLVAAQRPIVLFGADGGGIVRADECLFRVAGVEERLDWVAMAWWGGVEICRVWRWE